MITRAERIQKLLRERFAPESLEIVDETRRHKNHQARLERLESDAGPAKEGETHFAIRMVSPVFQGLGRVQAHRLVQKALAEEFETGLHSLRLTLKAPASS